MRLKEKIEHIVWSHEHEKPQPVLPGTNGLRFYRQGGQAMQHIKIDIAKCVLVKCPLEVMGGSKERPQRERAVWSAPEK